MSLVVAAFLLSFLSFFLAAISVLNFEVLRFSSCLGAFLFVPFFLALLRSFVPTLIAFFLAPLLPLFLIFF